MNNLHWHASVGYDGRLVHKTGRVSFQVRERLHDRDGVLGWSRAEESAVSCAESKSGDKCNPPRLKEGKKLHSHWYYCYRLQGMSEEVFGTLATMLPSIFRVSNPLVFKATSTPQTPKKWTTSLIVACVRNAIFIAVYRAYATSIIRRGREERYGSVNKCLTFNEFFVYITFTRLISRCIEPIFVMLKNFSTKLLSCILYFISSPELISQNCVISSTTA